MFKIDSAKRAKKCARTLEKALAPMGVPLQRGQALDVLAKLAGFVDWNAMSAQLQPPAAEPETFSILDVPLSEVSNVTVDGEVYEVKYVVNEVMEWVPKWDSPDNPYKGEEAIAVIDLWYLDDGLAYDKSLSAETLLSLKWSATDEGFVSGRGEVVKFYFTVPFGRGWQALRQAST